MARAGDVLENPATGDRLVFLRTAAETGGEELQYELEFVPRGFAARDHLHPRQEERHEVLEGRLGFVVDGRRQTLGPGESVTFPPGVVHRLFAVDDDLVRVGFEIRPALRAEYLIEAFFRLASSGKVSRRGYPNPLQLAVLAHAYRDEGHPTRPPVAVQRAAAAALAPIGHLLGYRP